MLEKRLEDRLTRCRGVIVRRKEGWELSSMPVWTWLKDLSILLGIGADSCRHQSRTKLVFCFFGSDEVFFLLPLSSWPLDLPFCLTLFTGSSRLEAAGRFLPIFTNLALVVELRGFLIFPLIDTFFPRSALVPE
jgi:hypothetical protein